MFVCLCEANGESLIAAAAAAGDLEM